MTHGIAEVELTCGHMALFSPAPTKGDVVFCRMCQQYHITKQGLEQPPSFTVTVKCEDCIYTRNFGEKADAIRRADSHSIRHNHVVNVRAAGGKGRILKKIIPP